jgi:hypothetical protein
MRKRHGARESVGPPSLTLRVTMWSEIARLLKLIVTEQGGGSPVAEAARGPSCAKASPD